MTYKSANTTETHQIFITTMFSMFFLCVVLILDTLLRKPFYRLARPTDRRAPTQVGRAHIPEQTNRTTNTRYDHRDQRGVYSRLQRTHLCACVRSYVCVCRRADSSYVATRPWHPVGEVRQHRGTTSACSDTCIRTHESVV